MMQQVAPCRNHNRVLKPIKVLYVHWSVCFLLNLTRATSCADPSGRLLCCRACSCILPVWRNMPKDSVCLAPCNDALPSPATSRTHRKKAGRAALGWKGIIQKHRNPTLASEDRRGLNDCGLTRHGVRVVAVESDRRSHLAVVVQKSIAAPEKDLLVESTDCSCLLLTHKLTQHQATPTQRAVQSIQASRDSSVATCLELQAAEALIAIRGEPLVR